MCAISASPEAGDASADVMSAKRKGSMLSDSRNSSFARQDENAQAARYIPAISANSISTVKNKNYEKFAWNDPSRRTSNVERVADYHGFPYYRSDKTNGSRDTVLVKDVGVSCSLLKENAVDPGVSITGFENYLVKQLKLEYKELSDITRKINAYTKDILSSLASRYKREDQAVQKSYVASRRHMASQCMDEAENSCLKLRFRNDAGKKCRPSEVDVINNFSEKDIAKRRTYEKRTSTKRRRAELDKAFSKRILELSPKCSGVLLRNYLIMKREKVPSNSSKTYLRKAEISASPSRLCRHRGADKSRKSFYTSKCDPLVLTNWREVSRRKAVHGSKNAFTASTSGESRCIASCI